MVPWNTLLLRERKSFCNLWTEVCRLLPKAAAGWNIVSVEARAWGDVTRLAFKKTINDNNSCNSCVFRNFSRCPTQSLTVVSALPGFTQKSPDGIEIGKAASGPFHFSSLLIGCIRFDMGCLLLPIFLWYASNVTPIKGGHYEEAHEGDAVGFSC